ncbi:MAG: peptidase C39 family protein [Thermoplasmata archaeon]
MALPVPYFKQTMLGSCGPACVQMVRGWLDRSPVVPKGSDMVPWVRSWIAPFSMTESFGLATLLLSSGARVTVVKERPRFQFRPESGSNFDKIGKVFGYLATPGARFQEWQARRAGVHLQVETVTVDRLRQPDALGRPAIVMVNQGSYAPDPNFPEGVLHWVVVTGLEDGWVQFHDPDLGADQRLSSADFDRAMDVRSRGIDRQLILTERRTV